jgi:hypothetical protein
LFSWTVFSKTAIHVELIKICSHIIPGPHSDLKLREAIFSFISHQFFMRVHLKSFTYKTVLKYSFSIKQLIAAVSHDKRGLNLIQTINHMLRASLLCVHWPAGCSPMARSLCVSRRPPLRI